MWKRRRQAVGQRRCLCLWAITPIAPLGVPSAVAAREAHTRNREHLLAAAAHRAERAFSRCALHLPLYFGYCVSGRRRKIYGSLWWARRRWRSSREEKAPGGRRLLLDQDLATPFEPRTPHLQFRFFARARRKPDNLRACHVGLRDFTTRVPMEKRKQLVDACLLSLCERAAGYWLFLVARAWLPELLQKAKDAVFLHKLRAVKAIFRQKFAMLVDFVLCVQVGNF
jgi:hypothetical protein